MTFLAHVAVGHVDSAENPTIVPFRSIRSLYALALAEGEGVGTAYEYFAKRLVLRRWLAKCQPVRRVLIAGLPEKYGSSLDFLLLAEEMGAAEVVIADDRQDFLDKARRSLQKAQSVGELKRLECQYVLAHDLGRARELVPGFDLCLSSEVLQRLGPQRDKYVANIRRLAAATALFAPNGDNPHHTSISGLSGLRLKQLRALLEMAAPVEAGYIDMPPFPPGITRSAQQRQRASSGGLEALSMWGLGFYARLETSFPVRWRQRHSHIVYALSRQSPASSRQQ